MRSSVRFGGSRAAARTRIEIGATSGTEACTVLATEWEARNRERELFPNGVPYIHSHHWCCKRVHTGVVARIGIGAEQDIDVGMDRVTDILEAPAAGSPDPAVQRSAPQKFVASGLLQPPPHLDRSIKFQHQPGEGRISRFQSPDGVHRAPMKIPQIDRQHSR